MMKKRTWLTAVGVITLGATLAFAGPGEGEKSKRGHHGRQAFGGQLEQKLDLTDAQKEQIEAIRKESREQNAEFFEQMKTTRQQFQEAKHRGDETGANALRATMEAQREQMIEIRDAEMQRIEQVLTEEQRTQLQQMKEKMEERRGRRGEHRKGGAAKTPDAN
jgi:Spy/CpxP family protein refolding chaperone